MKRHSSHAHVAAQAALFTLALLACGADVDVRGGGGTGGIAGSGGTGGMACTPNTSEPCYTGPSGTEEVGSCSAGARTCLEDGSGYGECAGEVLPASETCNTPEDDDCDGETNEEGAGCPWSKRFGDDAGQFVQSITTDAAGNVLVTGYFEGTLDFGGSPLNYHAGGHDGFVAKLDPAGNHLWSKGFGGAGPQSGLGVATDAAGNVVLTGHFEGTVDFGGAGLTSAGGGDVFVAKLAPDGNHLWSKRFGEVSDQYGVGVATDAAGNVLVTGNYSGTVDFGGGPLSANYGSFVAKLDPAGNHQWSKSLDGTNVQYGYRSVATDAAGNVVLTGDFLFTVDFGGGPLASVGGRAVFAAKLDPAGNHLWSKRFGGVSEAYGLGVTTDATGNVVLTGSFQDTVDFGGGPLTSVGSYAAFVAKLDPAGNHLWSQRSFGDANNHASDVATDAAGNVLVTGMFRETVDFGGGPLTSPGGHDVFVAKLDPAGNHLWSKGFGDEGTQYGIGVTTDAAGNVLVTGWVQGTLDFGGGPLTSAGSYDVFVAKLAP